MDFLLPSWIELKQPFDRDFQTVIEKSVDKGEASAIALAVELNDYLLIIDDLKGRNFALQLGLTIIGTMGVIVDAKLTRVISSVKPLLANIKATNFRISENVEILILNKAGE